MAAPVHLRPPTPLELAVRMHDVKARVAGYRLAANELLDRAEELRKELAEMEDLLDVIRESDEELEKDMRSRKRRRYADFGV